MIWRRIISPLGRGVRLEGTVSRELIFWNVEVKTIEIGQLDSFWSGHPWPTILDPHFGWKKCQPCSRGDLKRFKERSRRGDFFGHLIHSMASPSLGLGHKIQLWGHKHHYNHFTVSKKNTFCLGRITVFFGALVIFHGLYGLLQPKKGVCQISNYRAKSDVRVDFLEWKYVEIGQIDFFGQRTPDRQNGPKMVPKVPETTRKTAPKVPKWPKKKVHKQVSKDARNPLTVPPGTCSLHTDRSL